MEENAYDEEKKCQLGGGGVQMYVRRLDGYYAFPSLIVRSTDILLRSFNVTATWSSRIGQSVLTVAPGKCSPPSEY